MCSAALTERACARKQGKRSQAIAAAAAAAPPSRDSPHLPFQLSFPLLFYLSSVTLLNTLLLFQLPTARLSCSSLFSVAPHYISITCACAYSKGKGHGVAYGRCGFLTVVDPNWCVQNIASPAEPAAMIDCQTRVTGVLCNSL